MTKLNTKQELFCKLYSGPREFFGNATQSYIEAYKPDQKPKNWYKSAQASASRLLSNVIISERIKELFEELGLTDKMVDTELAFVIIQRKDLGAKIRAIAEYNKIRQRIEIKEYEVPVITGMQIIYEGKE
ncbi:MAG: terminase small subunit [Patescibacteria group bacterium]